MSATDPLDRIQVKEPCQADWDSMIGNDRMRFCTHCSLSVHDLSRMTRKSARRLVEKSKGRLCIRYRHGKDGSIITQPALSQKIFRIGRRVSRIAAGAFSASLSLSSAAVHASVEPAMSTQGSAVLAHQDPSRQVYVLSTITGAVTDTQGFTISGATVSLFKKSANFSLTTSTNAEGEYKFEGLETGPYRLQFEAPGYTSVDSVDLYLLPNSSQRNNVILKGEDAREESSRERFVTMGAMAIAEPFQPLVKAAEEDELMTVLALVTRDNVNARDKVSDTTALEHAVRNGNREMLQVLISVGADVNARNNSKETALMMLTEDGTADIVWDLIHAGAKLELKDEDGDTALMEAAMVNNVSVLHALLQAGANVSAKNDEGQTALMLAALSDRPRNVKALIAAGADMNACDKKGKTPLTYAKEESNERIVKLLQSYGATEGNAPEEK